MKQSSNGLNLAKGSDFHLYLLWSCTLKKMLSSYLKYPFFAATIIFIEDVNVGQGTMFSESRRSKGKSGPACGPGDEK